METKKHNPMFGIMPVLLGFLIFHFVGFTYNRFAASYADSLAGYWGGWWIRYAVLYIIGMPLFIILTVKAPGEFQPESHKTGLRRFLKYLIITFGAMIIGANIGKVILMFTKGIAFTAPPIYFMGGGNLGALLFLPIAPPVMEELFFRKILLRRLTVFGSGVAVFGSAFLFFLYHTLITSFEPHIFLMGIVLAYIMLRTNNIVYPIIFHSAVNIFSVLNTRMMAVFPTFFMLLFSFITLAIPVSLIIVAITNRSKIIGVAKMLFQNKTIEIIH